VLRFSIIIIIIAFAVLAYLGSEIGATLTSQFRAHADAVAFASN
jgi:Flp pilus assembly pilin Flp